MAHTLPTEANITIEGGKTYFDWVQQVSDGNFFGMILLGIFVILFSILRVGTNSGKAFVGSSFICMALAILLTTLGWLAPMYMYITILLTAIGAVWAYMSDSYE